MELESVKLPVGVADRDFVLHLKGSSLATIVAALRAFVEQPETHDVATIVYNDVVDQANLQYRMNSLNPPDVVLAGRSILKCTRSRGHDGSCNGYPHMGCPPSIMKLPDRPDF